MHARVVCPVREFRHRVLRQECIGGDATAIDNKSREIVDTTVVKRLSECNFPCILSYFYFIIIIIIIIFPQHRYLFNGVTVFCTISLICAEG